MAYYAHRTPSVKRAFISPVTCRFSRTRCTASPGYRTFKRYHLLIRHLYNAVTLTFQTDEACDLIVFCVSYRTNAAKSEKCVLTVVRSATFEPVSSQSGFAANASNTRPKGEFSRSTARRRWPLTKSWATCWSPDDQPWPPLSRKTSVGRVISRASRNADGKCAFVRARKVSVVLLVIWRSDHIIQSICIPFFRGNKGARRLRHVFRDTTHI